MLYKKFKTDKDDCYTTETFSIFTNSNEIVMSQLITDGIIDRNNEKQEKKEIADFKFEYLDEQNIDTLKQYLSKCDFVTTKKVIVRKPSYCMFNLYKFDDNRWILLGRTIIVNKKNKMFYDLKINENISYIEDAFLLNTKPNSEIQNQKILTRK